MTRLQCNPEGQRAVRRAHARLRAILVATALAVAPFASGDTVRADGASGDVSGEVELELRAFANDPLDPRQHGDDGSVAVEVEAYRDWADGKHRVVVTAFGRWDARDDERTHVDVREAYWRGTWGSTDLFVGVRKVFWGVAESLHLVDIVNQTDLVENLDTEDKLGQPMVQASFVRDWGTVDLFALPYFRERTFPGRSGRLRTPLPIDGGEPVYESSAEDTRLDHAFRWSHVLGNFDVGVSWFDGTSREPRLVPDLARPDLRLVPHYDRLRQAGVDVQYTGGDWLWKLEAVGRDGFDGRTSAAVGGFEYTLVGLGSTVLDLGIVAEYQWDERPARVAFGQDDLAVGSRLTFNDTQDTDLLALVAFDLDGSTRFFSVEGNRRLGANWEVELEVRAFSNPDPREVVSAFRSDDYAQLSVTRFF